VGCRQHCTRRWSQVTPFRPDDKVWYAGSIARPGTNAERHGVDERIVGKMPASPTFAQAGALPLTSLTAWELLFDRLQGQSPETEGGAMPGARRETLATAGIPFYLENHRTGMPEKVSVLRGDSVRPATL
jgi:hypothetical protein